LRPIKYDIIVIGAGSAGLSVSLFTNKTGLKTLLVDKSDEHIGGDCLNYGCVPSKALIHVSRIIHQAKEAANFGHQSSGSTDFKKVFEYVTAKQNIIRRHENADFLRREGLDVVLGTAYFISSNAIQVGDRQYSAKRIVLATGSRPAELNVPGIEKVTQFNNETIFNNDHLPARILVVGGGPMGVETGQALNRLGIRVTIVHRGDGILPRDEKEMGEILSGRLRKEGIIVHLLSEVKAFTSGQEAVIQRKDGSSFVQHFDSVFVAIGRRFDLN
jgi:pyruvate/2-oxoglutarate dehydrogenase complex dihydrolipoamide dehydrogenase (E3) component